MVVDLFDHQTTAERLPGESPPPGSLDGVGCLGELRPELVERAERLIDRGTEGTIGFAAAVRRDVLPEDGVEDVAGDVESEGLLQPHDVDVGIILTSIDESVQGGIGTGNVGGGV